MLTVLLALLIPCFLKAQYIYKIKADSVRIYNDSCTAELILENRTKDTLGFLYNKGNGRTEFRRALIPLGNMKYLSGRDTINVSNGGTWGNIVGALSDQIDLRKALNKGYVSAQFLPDSSGFKLIRPDSTFDTFKINKQQAGNYLTIETDPIVRAINGIVKSNGTTISAAVAADFPILNQNTTGNAATVTTNANLIGDVTSVGNTTTLATVNSNVGTFNNVTINGKGLVTAGSNVAYLTSAEPVITAGTTLQYWRGDKTFQTLNTTVVPEGASLYYTDTRARASHSLTTTGTSGAATYDNVTGIFNIPNYAGGGSSGWGLAGNTYASGNFIGTTSNNSFRIKTNNTERMVVDSNGRVGIGMQPNSAAYQLDVTGSLRTTSNIVAGLDMQIGASRYFYGNQATFQTANNLGNNNTSFWTMTNFLPSANSGLNFSRLLTLNKLINRGTQDGVETVLRVDYTLTGTAANIFAIDVIKGKIAFRQTPVYADNATALAALGVDVIYRDSSGNLKITF